jgi:hypothetical protein
VKYIRAQMDGVESEKVVRSRLRARQSRNHQEVKRILFERIKGVSEARVEQISELH